MNTREAHGPSPFAGLTRRELLKLSLGATALGIAAPLLPGCGPPAGAPPRPATLTHLSDLEFAVLQRAAPVVLPPLDAGLPDYHGLPVFENLDRFFATFPAPVRKQAHDGLVFFEYGALFLGWHLRPFTRLSDDDARAYVIHWRTGLAVQKAVYQLVARSLISCYWQAPATWKAVNYAGPLYLREAIPSLGDAPMPPPRGEEAS